MLSLIPLITLVLSFCSAVSATSSTGDSVLVVVDAAQKNDYSIFFDGLQNRGFSLTFRGTKDEGPLLLKEDRAQFDHVVLLSTDTKTFAKDFTPQNLVQLLSLNTNLLIATSPKQNFITSLASEFSLILPPPGTPLISYFPEREDPASVIPIPASQSSILSPALGPVWFSGIPFALGNSPYLVPILNAPAESFAADSDGGSDALADAAERAGEGLWAGSSLGVVTGFQVLGGARVTWVGGAELFSNKFAEMEFQGKKSGNKQFALDVTGWTFQESQVLRVDHISHHIANSTTSKEQYTTKDLITYEIDISKFNSKDGLWEPHSGILDLQLDFTMLDPHVRSALRPVLGTPGKYSTTFRAPDRHGVFKFIVNYKRPGWTHLFSSTTVPVVPPRHDGYPRFLSAAWPYYMGAFSASIGVFLFSAIWLAGETKEVGKKKVGKIE